MVMFEANQKGVVVQERVYFHLEYFNEFTIVSSLSGFSSGETKSRISLNLVQSWFFFFESTALKYDASAMLRMNKYDLSTLTFDAVKRFVTFE